MISAIATIIMVLVYLYVPVGDTGLLLLGIPLNMSILMKFAPMGPFMTELYPTKIRGTGQGFCYNAGRAIGSVFMTAIGFATAVMPLGTAIALFSTLAHGLMIVMLLLLPETRGRIIASLEPGGAGRGVSLSLGRRKQLAGQRISAGPTDLFVRRVAKRCQSNERGGPPAAMCVCSMPRWPNKSSKDAPIGRPASVLMFAFAVLGLCRA